MKGLLLKDFYMIRKYCKSYLLIAAVFWALSFSVHDNMFFAFYPVLLCGMIPVNLLGYDEKHKWLQYSAALPYTKLQIVTSKYLIGLITQLVMMLITGVIMLIHIGMNGSIRIDEFFASMLTILNVSMITSSISLPFVFKMGVEKGRIAYYFMIGVIFAVVFSTATLFSESLINDNLNVILWMIFSFAGIVIYALSWYLSVVFYKKKEL
ncbi:MAG: ABC-2 transporter permease [Clostridium sp.]|nr:ABC-2 transporter permease [Clostridium sp.]MCM1547862.1 ABC-2 transporter permease [Ruminococcus sp.]